MLRVAFSKTFNLINSQSTHPTNDIVKFAKADREAVRSLFNDLFDERKPLKDRLLHFEEVSNSLRKQFNPEAPMSQRPGAITGYLWLRYPLKYPMYKYELACKVAQAIDPEVRIKKGDNVSVIRAYELYNRIWSQITPQQLDIVRKLLKQNGLAPRIEKGTILTDFGYWLGKRC